MTKSRIVTFRGRVNMKTITSATSSRAKTLAGIRTTFGFRRIGNPPKFIEHDSRSHSPNPDAALQKLAAESVHESLHGVFRGTVNGFPMNGLVPGNGTGHHDITRSALDQVW